MVFGQRVQARGIARFDLKKWFPEKSEKGKIAAFIDLGRELDPTVGVVGIVHGFGSFNT